jgi:hypothetical protein
MDKPVNMCLLLLYKVMRLGTLCGVLLPPLYFVLTVIVAETVKGKGRHLHHIFKKTSVNIGSFSNNGSKDFSDSKKLSKPKDGASTSKSFTKSIGIDTISKRKVAFTNKPFESWNKAKSKLTGEEYNKHRITNSCINCGNAGHKFSGFTKPKP